MTFSFRALLGGVVCFSIACALIKLAMDNRTVFVIKATRDYEVWLDEVYLGSGSIYLNAQTARAEKVFHSDRLDFNVSRHGIYLKPAGAPSAFKLLHLRPPSGRPATGNVVSVARPNLALVDCVLLDSAFVSTGEIIINANRRPLTLPSDVVAVDAEAVTKESTNVRFALRLDRKDIRQAASGFNGIRVMVWATSLQDGSVEAIQWQVSSKELDTSPLLKNETLPIASYNYYFAIYGANGQWISGVSGKPKPMR